MDIEKGTEDRDTLSTSLKGDRPVDTRPISGSRLDPRKDLRQDSRQDIRQQPKRFNAKRTTEDDFVSTQELYDFFGEQIERKFSGIIEIQLKRGSIKRWAKTSNFRRIGGGNNQ